MRNSFANRLTLPGVIIKNAAAEATLDARIALADARRELSKPRVARRPAPAIHGGVLRATKLADALARKAAAL